MLSLESWCIPVVLGGVPMLRNDTLSLKNKQEYNEGRYSVDKVLKTVLLQTRSNRSDVCKQSLEAYFKVLIRH